MTEALVLFLSWNMVALLALLFVAEILGTVGGFGSSLLVMPVMSWFVPFEQALGLTAVMHVFSNVAKVYFFRAGVSRHLLLWLGVPAILGVLIGAKATAYLDGRWITIALGIVLLATGALLLLLPRWKLAATRSNAIGGGVLSGFVAGLTGTGGAIRGVALAAFDLEKLAFVSTSAWIDLGVDLSRTVVYAQQGYMNDNIFYFLPGLLIVSVSGSWIGRWMLARVPQRAFRSLVLGLVAVMGAVTLVRALMG